MEYHTTTADLMALAADEGFTVGEIPEGMDPVGALVIVLNRGGGEADEVETGTIDFDDIMGTGPFILFQRGLLVGVGYTTTSARKEIWRRVEGEQKGQRWAEERDRLGITDPFTASAPKSAAAAGDREQQLCCVEGCMEPVAFPLTP